jgi:hypothetical protein
MLRFLLAGVTLLPALAGLVLFIRAVRSRSSRKVGSIIGAGVLTAVVGVVANAAVVLSLFPSVGAAPPEEKVALLASGLPRGSLAAKTGLAAGALLGILGGFTRSFFASEVSETTEPQDPNQRDRR